MYVCIVHFQNSPFIIIYCSCLFLRMLAGCPGFCIICIIYETNIIRHVMEYMLSYLFSEIFFTCFGRVNRQDYVSYFILMKMDGIIFRAIVSNAGASNKRAGLRSISCKTRLQWQTTIFTIH